MWKHRPREATNLSLKLNAFPYQAKEQPWDFFIFWIKEEKRTAGSEIILFIQPIELYKCSHWLEVNPQWNSQVHHGYIIHHYINCDNYVCLRAFALWVRFTWLCFLFFHFSSPQGLSVFFLAHKYYHYFLHTSLETVTCLFLNRS